MHYSSQIASAHYVHMCVIFLYAVQKTCIDNTLLQLTTYNVQNYYYYYYYCCCCCPG